MQDAILRGNNFEVTVQWKNRYGREMKYTTGFEGVMPYIERKYLEAESASGRSSATASTCARSRARSATASGSSPRCSRCTVDGHSHLGGVSS